MDSEFFIVSKSEVPKLINSAKSFSLDTGGKYRIRIIVGVPNQFSRGGGMTLYLASDSAERFEIMTDTVVI